jgi:hypothetical protein
VLVAYKIIVRSFRWRQLSFVLSWFFVLIVSVTDIGVASRLFSNHSFNQTSLLGSTVSSDEQ